MSLKKLITRKIWHKNLFLTYVFPNFGFLLEAFLPDALDVQPLPPKENIGKTRCCSVSLTWSHQTEWGDVQGSHWIQGDFCCMGNRERSKEQWGAQKGSTKENQQNLAHRKSLSQEFFQEPSQTQALTSVCPPRVPWQSREKIYRRDLPCICYLLYRKS